MSLFSKGHALIHSHALRRTAVLVALYGGCSVSMAWAQLRADVYVSGLSSPVAFVQDPSNAGVQYVVEQAGRIRVVNNGTLASTDFLNLAGQISPSGEQGLLGLAFPGNYATSGRFFVYFTSPSGNVVIARFKRSSGNPLVADPASRFDFRWSDGNRFITHPFGNHNGGTLAFGPDGYLYAGPGDGGSGGDPFHNAQNPNSLLGKILRLDVNVPDTDIEGYDIPPDNPFLDGVPISALPQIWAFGVRNPFKFSFDNPARGGTGALVIGDVGQNLWEEIDYQPPGQGGRNFGWRNREGAHNYDTSLPPAYLPLTDPIFEYGHGTGVSIIGGYVYRGLGLGPGYPGRYFFADLTGRVWSIGLIVNGGTGEATASGQVEHTAEFGGTATLGNISSFGEDANGELYFVSYSHGTVFRLTVACSVTLNPPSASYGAAASTGQVSVTSACAWPAASYNSFVTVTGGSSGSGNGIVSYSVASNNVVNSPRPARSATLSIGDQLFRITQAGCNFGISPTAASYDASGGSGAVNVSAQAGCTWTAVSNNGFLNVTAGASGTGNGTVTFTAQANVGAPNVATPARSGSLSIAGQTFGVSQSGCTFSIAPTGTAFGSSGGAGGVSVTTPAACSWTVTGSPVWVSTTAGGSGTGPGTWRYSVAANGTGAARSQTIGVGGQSFALTQLAVTLSRLVPGHSATFTLANASAQRWLSIEMVANRSYCAQLAPAPAAVTQATPTLSVFRADGTTSLGAARPTGTCFVAPATETAVVRVTQSDNSARSYRLRLAETTLWANWFFIGSGYSSFTLIRNTTSGSLSATITWRSETGVVVGSETVAIPAGSVIFRDARLLASGAIMGSVEVGHDGEPQALVGSQTTLSATTGLSLDTLIRGRSEW